MREQRNKWKKNAKPDYQLLIELLSTATITAKNKTNKKLL